MSEGERGKVTYEGVHYEKVSRDYFEKRTLRRYARVGSLWALGVGAVISGHYSGWNPGLAAGGFGGFLIAAIIIGIMYVGLCYCLAEMSPALPHTGAAYSFARSAMGPWGGYITGLAENIEYVITPAVITFFIGAYMGGIFGTPDAYQPIWWIVFYGIFLVLNLLGVDAFLTLTQGRKRRGSNHGFRCLCRYERHCQGYDERDDEESGNAWFHSIHVVSSSVRSR